jgi:hypothetical protein
MFFFRGLAFHMLRAPARHLQNGHKRAVKAASEINESRTVATAARKIQNINLMPGPSGYGAALSYEDRKS